LNLSAPKAEYVGKKLAAYRRYLLWLNQQLPDAVFQAKLKAGIGRLFPNQLQHWGGKPRLGDALKFWLFFWSFTGRPNFALLRALLGVPGLKRSRRPVADGLPGLASPSDTR